MVQQPLSRYQLGFSRTGRVKFLLRYHGYKRYDVDKYIYDVAPGYPIGSVVDFEPWGTGVRSENIPPPRLYPGRLWAPQNLPRGRF